MGAGCSIVNDIDEVLSIATEYKGFGTKAGSPSCVVVSDNGGRHKHGFQGILTNIYVKSGKFTDHDTIVTQCDASTWCNGISKGELGIKDIRDSRAHLTWNGKGNYGEFSYTSIRDKRAQEKRRQKEEEVNRLMNSLREEAAEAQNADEVARSQRREEMRRREQEREERKQKEAAERLARQSETTQKLEALTHSSENRRKEKNAERGDRRRLVNERREKLEQSRQKLNDWEARKQEDMKKEDIDVERKKEERKQMFQQQAQQKQQEQMKKKKELQKQREQQFDEMNEKFKSLSIQREADLASRRDNIEHKLIEREIQREETERRHKERQDEEEREMKAKFDAVNKAAEEAKQLKQRNISIREARQAARNARLQIEKEVRKERKKSAFRNCRENAEFLTQFVKGGVISLPTVEEMFHANMTVKEGSNPLNPTESILNSKGKISEVSHSESSKQKARKPYKNNPVCAPINEPFRTKRPFEDTASVNKISQYFPEASIEERNELIEKILSCNSKLLDEDINDLKVRIVEILSDILKACTQTVFDEAMRAMARGDGMKLPKAFISVLEKSLNEIDDINVDFWSFFIQTLANAIQLAETQEIHNVLPELRNIFCNILEESELTELLNNKGFPEKLTFLDVFHMENCGILNVLDLQKSCLKYNDDPTCLSDVINSALLEHSDVAEAIDKVNNLSRTSVAAHKKKQTEISSAPPEANVCDKTLEEILSSLEKGLFEADRISILTDVLVSLDKYLKKSRFRTTIESGVDFVRNYFTGKEKRESKQKEMKKVLKTLCDAVYKFAGYAPRLTQILSVAVLLDSNEKERGQILQILTGEGKSCIVAMAAVGLIIYGKKKTIDVIVPSEILAERDCKEWAGYYKLFKILASCNVSAEDIEECYQCQVVYGTVSSFAGDILRHEFQFKTIRGSRGFDAVIVDEVDSLLVDQGVQMTYLSHKAGDLKLLDPIFPLILQNMSGKGVKRTEEGEEMVVEAPVTFVRILTDLLSGDEDKVSENTDLLQSVLAELLEEDLVSVDLIKKLNEGTLSEADLTEIPKEQTSTILNFCAENVPEFPNFSIFFEDGETICIQTGEDRDAPSVLVCDGGICQLLYADVKNYLKEKREAILSQINFDNNITDKEPTETNRTESKIPMPSHLKDFIEEMTDIWLDSALTASTMTEGRDYILQDGDVVPVDFRHTGVVQTNMRWSDGLQQFLQVRHRLRMAPLSIVTNFLSNLAYFKRYNKSMFGVSGTLGEDYELEFMKRTYSLNLNYVTPHKKRRLREKTGKVANDFEDFYTQLGQVVNKESHRTTLVVCNDINNANRTFSELEKLNQKETSSHISLKKYTTNKDTEQELSVKPGDVIVATNLAGRGTDIKINDDVEKAGGLNVVVCFLPLNKRVEEQVFGRSGRKGQPGTAMILVNCATLDACYQDCDTVDEMKVIRSDMSRLELQEHIHQALPEVEFKESLFKAYCKQMFKYYEEKVKDRADSKLIVEMLNERWGLFLKSITTHTKSYSTENRKSSKLELNKMFKQASTDVEMDCSPVNSCFQVLKHAERFMKEYKFCQATEILNKAVSMNSSWSAIAHYNLAFARISQDGKKLSEAIEDLEKADKRINDTWMENAFWTQLFSGVAPNSNPLLQDKETSTSNLFKQCELRMQIIHNFHQSIKENIKKLKEIKDSGKEAEAVETAIYHILEEADPLAMEEIRDLYKLGHPRMYSIQVKYKFPWTALVVALLGVLECALGTVLWCFGVVNIGTALIAEGISDIIEGGIGMITGEFDMKSWAKEKAIGIAVTIAAAGVGKLLSKIKTIAKNSTKCKKMVNVAKKSYKAVKVTGQKIGSGISKCGQYVGKQMMKTPGASLIKRVLTSNFVRKAVEFATPFVVQIGQALLGVAEKLVIAKIIEKVKENLRRSIRKSVTPLV